MKRRSPFRRVAIVGVGLIGGSIGLAVRRRLKGTRVIGVDRRAVLRRARVRGAIDEAAPALSRGLRDADIVVLALPVDGILAILPGLARRVPPEAVVTDVGSTKEDILRAARRSGLGPRFVGGHPMAGSEGAGIESARPDLFAGAPWILCPPGDARSARGRARGAAERSLRRVAALVRGLGARPAVLGAGEHDRVVARLSHLPQLVSVALTNAAGGRVSRRFLHLSGPALRQMSRLAGSPAGLWDGILRSNRRAAAGALEDFLREVRRLRASLGTGGPAAHFRRAARLRARIVPAGRGGGALW